MRQMMRGVRAGKMGLARFGGGRKCGERKEWERRMVNEMSRLAPPPPSDERGDGEVVGEWVYVAEPRNDGYPVCKRQRVGGCGDWEEVVDYNSLFDDLGVSSLGFGPLRVSPDGHYAGLALDLGRGEGYALLVKCISGGGWVGDGQCVVGGMGVSAFEWAPDSSGLYAVDDVGDKLVFAQIGDGGEVGWVEEVGGKELGDLPGGERGMLTLGATKGARSVQVGVLGENVSAVYMVEGGGGERSSQRLQCVREPEEGVRYVVGDYVERESGQRRLGSFVMSFGSSQFVDVADGRVVVETESGFVVEDVDIMDRGVVCYGRDGGDGGAGVEILGLEGGSGRMVDVRIGGAGRVGEVVPGLNPDPGAEVVEFDVSSPVWSGGRGRAGLDGAGGAGGAGGAVVVDRGNGVEGARFERRMVKAKDGERIPVGLATPPPGVEQVGMLVNVYGGYGMNLSEAYDETLAALLTQGVSVAYAHVRGGGERGMWWHHSGYREHKRRSVTDFVDVLTALYDDGLATPESTCAHGVSAAGIPIGRTMAEFPHLLAGSYLKVPFLDVVGELCGGDGRHQGAHRGLSRSDVAEYGDVGVDVFASYCPLSALVDSGKSKEGGHLVVKVAENDDRVDVAGVLRYLEAYETVFPDARVEVDVSKGGHFDDASPEKAWAEASSGFGFLWENVWGGEGRVKM